MKNIMKFEIDKTANNISFLVTTMITIIIMMMEAIMERKA